MRDRFHWARLLSFVTGLVNQDVLLRNEYLTAENRILRAHLPARLRLSDAERSTLAEVAKRLGRKALQDVARVAKPDTLTRLVSTTGGAEVRWLPLSCLSRPPTDLARSGGVGNPVGTGEPWLGI